MTDKWSKMNSEADEDDEGWFWWNVHVCTPSWQKHMYKFKYMTWTKTLSQGVVKCKWTRKTSAVIILHHRIYICPPPTCHGLYFESLHLHGHLPTSMSFYTSSCTKKSSICFIRIHLRLGLIPIWSWRFADTVFICSIKIYVWKHTFIWHVFGKLRCLKNVTVQNSAHVSHHCPWPWTARPRPSVQPVQTGSHQRAARCVETWTASAWWSSSCPSFQPHHRGPQACGNAGDNSHQHDHYYYRRHLHTHHHQDHCSHYNHQQLDAHCPANLHCMVMLLQCSLCAFSTLSSQWLCLFTCPVFSLLCIPSANIAE